MRNSIAIGLMLLLTLATMPGTVQALTYSDATGTLADFEWDGGPSEFEFADIDQDGYLDFLSIGDHGSPYINTPQHGVMVFWGNGGDSWTYTMAGTFGYGGIAVGDADNDGSWDVGYGMHHNYSGTDLGDQIIEVALGDGSGTNWTPWDDGLGVPQGNDDWYGMFATDFGDYNNDGLLDIGSASFGSGTGMHIYDNNGDGTWTQTLYVFDWSNSDHEFYFCDVNNDGYLDIVSALGNHAVYIGDGTGNWTYGVYNLPGGQWDYGLAGVAVGDVNGDGGDDIAFRHPDSYYPLVATLDTTGVEPVWEYLTSNLPQLNARSLELCDMNMDGRLDLLIGTSSGFEIWLQTDDPDERWQLDYSINIPDFGSWESLRTGGDLDNNGYPDILAFYDPSPGDNKLKVLLESSTPVDLAATVLRPRANEVIWAGAARFVDWISSVPEDGPGLVTLSFSASGPGGPWTMVAQDLPNSGRMQWTVPDVESENCYLKLDLTAGVETASAVSVAPFTVRGGAPQSVVLELLPSTTVIPPEGGTIIYDAHLLNNTAQQVQNVRFKTFVQLPDGQSVGPLMNFRFTLQPFMDIYQLGLTQEIPDYAPGGTYVFTGVVGRQQGPQVSNSFTFDKIGAATNVAFEFNPVDWYSSGPQLASDRFTDSPVTTELPKEFTMGPAYPNPFNSSTKISVTLPEASGVELLVFNVAGQQVAELVNGHVSAGIHQLVFDASQHPSGLYFVQFNVPGYADQVRKVVLVR
jgi:FG-GAP-like repeat/Secretion system C-terminal sorting domain